MSSSTPNLTLNPHDSGTVNTLPFTCLETASEAATFAAENRFAGQTDTQLGRLWANGAVDAARCAERSTETGELIGTGFAARDFMSVVDALGEDRMLRFSGYVLFIESKH